MGVQKNRSSFMETKSVKYRVTEEAGCEKKADVRIKKSEILLSQIMIYNSYQNHT